MSKTANPTVLTTKYVIYRVGQNHTYTVHARYFWQGNHQIYGHKRCIYTVLANPSYLTVYNLLLTHSLVITRLWSLCYSSQQRYLLSTRQCVY
jgi:hypothetical protein